MPNPADLVHQTTTGTGTGNLTLVAVNGKRTFDQAFGHGASTDVFDYYVSNQSAAEWEQGTGHMSDAATLVRDTVSASSNGGSAVSFSAGVKDVCNDVPAGQQTKATKALAEAGTDTAAVMSPQAVSQAILANALGHANIAGRNGGFEVWQRGSSIAVAASTTAYTCDGWYLATPASASHTVSRQAGLTSQSQYCARVQRDSGQTGTGTTRFAMPLDTDELLKAAGKALALIFTVSTGANWSPASGTLNYTVYFGTGAVAKRNSSAYTGETTPISGSVNLAQGASAAQVAATISPVVGSGVTCAEIQFSWTPGGTAGANDWFSIDDLDLRVVPAGLSSARPTFERSSYLADLLRCCRYLYVYNAVNGSNDSINVGGAFSTTIGVFMVPLTVPPRVPFSGVTASSPSHFFVANYTTGTSVAPTGIAVLTGMSVSAIGLLVTCSGGGLTQGGFAGFVSNNASAQLIFTGAEI